MVDIDRDGRDFEEHYMDGLKKLLPTRHPLVVYCEKKYFDPIRQMRGDLPTSCIEFDKSTLDKTLSVYSNKIDYFRRKMVCSIRMDERISYKESILYSLDTT